MAIAETEGLQRPDPTKREPISQISFQEPADMLPVKTDSDPNAIHVTLKSPEGWRPVVIPAEKIKLEIKNIEGADEMYPGEFTDTDLSTQGAETSHVDGETKVAQKKRRFSFRKKNDNTPINDSAIGAHEEEPDSIERAGRIETSEKAEKPEPSIAKLIHTSSEKKKKNATPQIIIPQETIPFNIQEGGMDPGEFIEIAQRIKQEIGKVMVGQEEIIQNTLIALIAGRHVLFEGVPGIGKTLLVRTIARSINLEHDRISFTPDLMPADITGTNMFLEDETTGRRKMVFHPGPIFTNLLLADEINRATPKTQSALLEAMEEHASTIFRVRRALPSPFFTLATQNPLEHEGVYSLPEAQLDRFFFKLLVESPSGVELGEILNRTTNPEEPLVEHVTNGESILRMGMIAKQVPISNDVRYYAIRLAKITHPGQDEFEVQPEIEKATYKYIRQGVSPRGAQTLIIGAKIKALMDGRLNVSYEDIEELALPAFRHRLILESTAEYENISPDDMLSYIMQYIPVKVDCPKEYRQKQDTNSNQSSNEQGQKPITLMQKIPLFRHADTQ